MRYEEAEVLSANIRHETGFIDKLDLSSELGKAPIAMQVANDLIRMRLYVEQLPSLRTEILFLYAACAIQLVIQSLTHWRVW